MKQKKVLVWGFLAVMFLTSCSGRTNNFPKMSNTTSSGVEDSAIVDTGNTVTGSQSTQLETVTNITKYENAPFVNSSESKEYTTTLNGVPQNPYPSITQVNVTQEIALTSSVTYRTPYTECAINAVFTGPNGQKMTVPGYWDGGQSWKVRFAVPSVGKWTYETSCSNLLDSGLNKQTGSLSAQEYTGDIETIKRGRLRVSDDKTYLTYGDGTPFFWLADTHWFAFSGREKLNFSNNAEYDSMFKGTVDQRAEEGYTAYQAILWVDNNMEMLLLQNEGGMQWLNNAVWEEMNPDYWKNVDTRMQYIISKGIVPVIGLSWSGSVTPSNLEDFKKIARYVIARYSSYPVIWNVAGEYNANGTISQALDNYGRLGQYMHGVDPYTNLTTIHASYYVSDTGYETPKYSVDYFRGQAWLDYVMSEGGHSDNFDFPSYNEWSIYNNRDYKIPWLEAEAKYEDIWEIPSGQTREIAYLSIMNGSLGYSYGAEGGWQSTWNSQDSYQTYGRFPVPWYKALNKVVGKTELPLMKQMFTSLPWWKLKPNTTLVNWNSTKDTKSVLFPTVKASTDKNYILIYYPMNSRNVNFDLYPDYNGVISGLDSTRTYSTYWFDTQTGVYTTVSTNIKADASGKYVLPKPENSLEKDYMFIMRANNSLSTANEMYLAAKKEINNIVLPRVTGEKALPKMILMDSSAQVIDFGVVKGVQGEDNFYYYSYNPVTEVYSELPVSTISQTYGWGDYVWWADNNKGEFITNNIFCAGPVNSACMTWVAPSDGEVVFNSRPSWKQLYQGGDGAVFTILQNDTKLAEFAFNSKNYNSDNYAKTIQVKAGDRISLMNRYNGTYGIYYNQIDINTKLYFSPVH